MILTDNLLEGARPHPYGQWQPGSIGVGKAAAGHSRRTADGSPEEILTHRQ
jgi:hypothetical protein